MGIITTTHNRIPQEELFVNLKKPKTCSIYLRGYHPLTSLSIPKIESLTTLICNKALTDKQQILLRTISDYLAGQAFHNPNNIPYNLRTHFRRLEAFSKTALGKKENLPPKLIKEIKDNFIMVALKKNKLELAHQTIDVTSMSTFPFLDAKNILNYLEASELDEPIVPMPRLTKASVFTNTFKNYCVSHENSFLNKVCLAALERKLASIPDSEKNKKSVIYEALVEVLKGYLEDTCDHTKLTLSEMLLHIKKLEASFHDDFKESYGIFFSEALKEQDQGLPHRLELRSKEELKDINLLAEVISKFHDSSSRDALNSIRTLHLSEENLRIVPPELKVLTNLERLCLDNTKITTPPDLSKNTLLEWLNLSNAQITTSPDLSKNTSLITLYLDNTKITTPPDLSKNTLLEWLSLDNTGITTPPDLSLNIALKRLCLDHTGITTPPDLSKNTRLKKLDLSNTKITTPPVLSLNVLLELLNLNNTQITTPPDLSKNTPLTVLGLSNTKITTPPDLSKNTLLGWLNLSNAQITTSPDLSKNTLLEWLNLSNAQITTPPDLSKNTLLKYLYLNGTQITVEQQQFIQGLLPHCSCIF